MPALTTSIIEGEISRELRRSVLRPAQPVGTSQPGDDNPDVVHLGAFTAVDGALVSACLLIPEQCPWLPDRPAWRLRGMATDPRRRRSGAGRAILIKARQVAFAAGAEILWCQARETALDFYRGNGWQEFGDLFDTDLGPHLRMWLELPG